MIFLTTGELTPEENINNDRDNDENQDDDGDTEKTKKLVRNRA